MGFTILIYVMSTVSVTNCNFLYSCLLGASNYISSAGARSCVFLECMARENKNDEHICIFITDYISLSYFTYSYHR